MKFEQKLSDGARRGAGCLLVAVLAASGLACGARARVEAGTAQGAPIAGRRELLGNGGEGAAEGVRDPEAQGAGREPHGGGASSGPLSEVTAAVSAANVQRLRDVARID